MFGNLKVGVYFNYQNQKNMTATFGSLRVSTMSSSAKGKFS